MAQLFGRWQGARREHTRSGLSPTSNAAIDQKGKPACSGYYRWVPYLAALKRIATRMARFQVRETFAIQDQPTFVLAGFVVEGEVWPGMEVGILFNTKIRIKAKIDRVEFVRRPDGDVVCLCFDCSAPDEVTLWEALSVRNQTIEIRPATLPLTTYPK